MIGVELPDTASTYAEQRMCASCWGRVSCAGERVSCAGKGFLVLNGGCLCLGFFVCF